MRTARAQSFVDAEQAEAFVNELADSSGAVPVIKADGLAAGKGVIVPNDTQTAHRAVRDMLGGMFGTASTSIVIEERLTGLEASAMAFVDGSSVVPMPFSCDYKRAFDEDEGPNTGGMGVYSPPGFLSIDLSPDIFGAVHAPVVAAMAADESPFRGVLYGGLMVDNGEASVVEFNVRFGDPEAQVILPQLESDLVDVMEACIEGRLGEVAVEWSGQPTVGIALASGGYPGPYETGKVITGLDRIDAGVLVFQAGTELATDGSIVTTGGRVLTVVASGSTLADARELAYDNASRIEFEGKMLRTDIALREL